MIMGVVLSLSQLLMAADGPPLSVGMLDELPFSAMPASGNLMSVSERTGCDPAFYRALLERARLPYRFESFSVNRLIRQIEQQRFDLVLIPALHLAPPAQQGYLYLGPVFSQRDLLVTRDMPLTTDLAAFRQMRIGQVASACFGLCQQLRLNAPRLRGFHNVEQGVALLVAKRIDALQVPEVQFHIVMAARAPAAVQPAVISYIGPAHYYYLGMSARLPPSVRQQITAAWQALGSDFYRQGCDRLYTRPQ